MIERERWGELTSHGLDSLLLQQILPFPVHLLL